MWLFNCVPKDSRDFSLARKYHENTSCWYILWYILFIRHPLFFPNVLSLYIFIIHFKKSVLMPGWISALKLYEKCFITSSRYPLLYSIYFELKLLIRKFCLETFFAKWKSSSNFPFRAIAKLRPSAETVDIK